MSRGSSLPAGMVPLSVLLFGLCLIGPTLASNHHGARQATPAPATAATSLVSSGTTAMQTLPKIILPAIRSLVGAPLRLLRQLALELTDFVLSHRFLEIYDLRFWQKIAARLPDRAATYWHTLVTMESQCTQRTLCDLADLTSRRTPKWFQQIVLIYLNTFSEVHPYYGVAIQGLTTHQCATLYAECNAEQFLERVRGNVTDSIATTVAPMRDAFNELVTVATSTISSLADIDVEDSNRVQPQPQTEFERLASSTDDHDQIPRESGRRPSMTGSNGGDFHSNPGSFARMHPQAAPMATGPMHRNEFPMGIPPQHFY